MHIAQCTFKSNLIVWNTDICERTFSKGTYMQIYITIIFANVLWDVIENKYVIIQNFFAQ
jgi:hypothetical protein